MNVYHKPGDDFDGYELMSHIGSGGSAEVWKVRDSKDELLAVKIFAPNKGLDSYGKVLFKEEYDKTKRLKHKNILVAKKYGIFKDRPYLVFPLCTGSLMSELRKRKLDKREGNGIGNFTEEEMAQIISDVTDGLEYLQKNGLIHQDIKPDNILIYEHKNGKIDYKLADFGISTKLRKTIIKQTNAFHDNKNGLSPDYAAPEQFKGSIHRKSDIFSLGVTLYELATGDTPSGDSKIGTGQILLNGGEVPAINGDYSNRFKNLILRCMETGVNERPHLNNLIASAKIYNQEGFWEEWLDQKIQNTASSLKVAESPKRQTAIKIPLQNTAEEPVKNEHKEIEKEVKEVEMAKPVYVEKEYPYWIWGLGFIACIGLSFFGFKYFNNNNAYSNAVSEAEVSFLKGDIGKAISNYQKAISIDASDEVINNRFEIIEAVKTEYTSMKKFSEGFAPVEKNGRWGAINSSGELIVSCEYDKVAGFKGNYSPVVKGELCGFIDKNGEVAKGAGAIKNQTCRMLNDGTAEITFYEKSIIKIDTIFR